MTEPKDPEQIQAEIERTREELGDTVEALAAKTNVKAQAKHKIEDLKAAAGERTEHAWSAVKEATPDSAGAAASQVSHKAGENPLPVAAIGAFAAGFLAGRLTKR